MDICRFAREFAISIHNARTGRNMPACAIRCDLRCSSNITPTCLVHVYIAYQHLHGYHTQKRRTYAASRSTRVSYTILYSSSSHSCIYSHMHGWLATLRKKNLIFLRGVLRWLLFWTVWCFLTGSHSHSALITLKSESACGYLLVPQSVGVGW